MNVVLSCCLVLCCIWLTECVDRAKNKACYKAKICVHNNVEKCGVNSNGKLRRFIDSCDIMEYNCLRETDFVKTPYERCANLPPMKDEPDSKDRNQSVNDVPDHQAVNTEQLGSEELPNRSEEEYKDIARIKHVNKTKINKGYRAQLKNVDGGKDQANKARQKERTF